MMLIYDFNTCKFIIANSYNKQQYKKLLQSGRNCFVTTIVLIVALKLDIQEIHMKNWNSRCLICQFDFMQCLSHEQKARMLLQKTVSSRQYTLKVD